MNMKPCFADDQSSHDLHIAPDVLLPPLPRHADDDEQAKPSSSSPATTSSTSTVASSPATTTHEAVAEHDEQMDDIQVIAADDETAEVHFISSHVNETSHRIAST